MAFNTSDDDSQQRFALGIIFALVLLVVGTVVGAVVYRSVAGAKGAPTAAAPAVVDSAVASQSTPPALAAGADLVATIEDGIVECVNGKNEMFGEERFISYITGHGAAAPQAFLDGLIAEITAFAGSAAFLDDITCLVLDLPEDITAR